MTFPFVFPFLRFVRPPSTLSRYSNFTLRSSHATHATFATLQSQFSVTAMLPMPMRKFALNAVTNAMLAPAAYATRTTRNLCT